MIIKMVSAEMIVRAIEGATITQNHIGWVVEVPLETCTQVLIRTCQPVLDEAAKEALNKRARADEIRRRGAGPVVTPEMLDLFHR